MQGTWPSQVLVQAKLFYFLLHCRISSCPVPTCLMMMGPKCSAASAQEEIQSSYVMLRTAPSKADL